MFTAKRAVIVAIVGSIILICGCSKYPANLVIGCEGEIVSKSVEIHVVGVNFSEKALWEQMSMSEYWKPGNQMAASSQSRRCAFYLGRNQSANFTVSKKEYPELWRKWEEIDASHIVILVDMPISNTLYKDEFGNADSRRLCLPLKSCCWKGGEIEFEVQSGSIIAKTFVPGKRMFCDCRID